MFTKSVLSTLIETAPAVGVSIFLPTHVRGAEVREGPIRLKNLIAEARNRLLAGDMKGAEADELLSPAMALVDNYRFWQHQNEGLALFLGGGEVHEHRVPLSFEERVVVGPGFHVRPLLPLLAADGAFHVLTITADEVRLFDASRFSMVEVDLDGAPEGLAEVKGRPDYENPLQAPPATRPGAAPIAISKSEVLGDSPEDWRKDRLVEYVRRVASAFEDRLASDAVPVVLVADAEVSGHFQKFSSLGPLLAGVVETNPAAMEDAALHEAAYALVCPQFDAGRQEAIEHLAALHGSGDERAAVRLENIVRAAREGRVDTLLLAKGASMPEGHGLGAEVASEGTGAGLDPLDATVVQTLQHGGSVYIVRPEDLPGEGAAGAVLRY